MPKLTPKQQRFVEEYLVDLNATRAYIAAGYAEKGAEQNACLLIRNHKVAAAIQKHMDKRSKRTEITADNVLQELAKIGFGNIQNLYDSDGNLLHPKDLPADVTATIQEVTEEVLRGASAKVDKEGGETEEIPAVVLRRKYKVADKKASLELLGKHLKLFTDKLEVDANLTVIRKQYVDD